MTHEEEVTPEHKTNFTFDKLQDVFFDFPDKLKKLGLKHKEPKEVI